MGFPPSARCRTTAVSAEIRSAAAAAASPATATTATAGSTGPAARPVRRTTAAGLRSCASPHFDGCGACAALAHHHAGVQEQQQFGGRAAGGVGREHPVELDVLSPNHVNDTCVARHCVVR